VKVKAARQSTARGADMETLTNARAIGEYGEASMFPVFGKKRQIEGAAGAAPHGAGMQRGTIG
jgi:hypothetical protein